MKGLTLLVAVAVTGCMPIYSRPTLRPGGNVAVTPAASPIDDMARALLCSRGIYQDTTRIGPKACQRATNQDPVPGLAPAPVPARKP